MFPAVHLFAIYLTCIIAGGITAPADNPSPYQPIVNARFPDAGGDPVVSTDSALCTIPFSRAGNLIVIRAQVDATVGNFILDTGAPGLILNMTYFRDYPSTAEQDEAGGITGATITSSPTVVDKLTFGPLKFAKVDAARANLGHIENTKGIIIHGLLGMQLFRRFEMIIDYEKNLLHFRLVNRKEAKGTRHPMLDDTSAYNIMPIELKDNKLMTYGEVAGKKLTFIVDTGAESNVLDSRLPDRIFENVSITGRIMLRGSGDAKVEALSGDMKNMTLSGRPISSLPVLVTNLEKMCEAYNDHCLDGMLGFDFLSLHKIGFNFVTRKMYIWK